MDIKVGKRVNKLKLFILTLIIVLGLVMLTGCSKEIKEGEVYNKEFKEAHTRIAIIPLTTFNGKTTTTVMIPYTYYYPDRYIIYIKKFEDNKWKTADYYVTKEIYETISIGDQFEYVEGRDLIDEPYTREKAQ